MQHADGIPGAFRAHFARHNRSVLALTAMTLVAAVLLWFVVYIVVYWMVLFAVTIGEGVDARVPVSYTRVFIAAALGLCFLGWVMHKIRPDYFPRDKKSPFEIFMDFVLAAPRVTLAIWGNLSAWQSLSEEELGEAWELFHTIGEQGRLSIHSLPLEIPDGGMRGKVVFALQVAGLVELRKNDETAWLALQNDKARQLSRTTMKIDAGRRR